MYVIESSGANALLYQNEEAGVTWWSTASMVSISTHILAFPLHPFSLHPRPKPVSLLVEQKYVGSRWKTDYKVYVILTFFHVLKDQKVPKAQNKPIINIIYTY